MTKRTQLVKEEITRLFAFAKKQFHIDPARSNRYVYLARKMAMKTNVSIPSELKRQFCHHCYHFLVVGSNCRVRTRNKVIHYYCLDCKKYNKVGYRKSYKV